MKALQRLFFRRPRILNALHALRLTEAVTQTYPNELALLAKYAAGARVAVEIGSFQGVSSGVIAAALRDDGRLYCVDPWPMVNGKKDPSYLIFRRHIARKKVEDRIVILRGTNRDMAEKLPRQIDFLFIDGDHSRDGLALDWSIARSIVRSGGHVCMHDVLVPASEPWRRLGSVDYFEEAIRSDPDFRLVAAEHSMAVVRRV